MSLKRFRINRHSVIVTWLLSYFSVLLVPIMISGIIYAATWHVVETEINRANESLLQQMGQTIDNSLGAIERLSVEITLNKRVASFLNVAKPLTDHDYYDLFTIANDLRMYRVANDYIHQIYIYYKNSDSVLSAREHMDSHALFDEVRQREDMSYEQWEDFFNKRYIQEYAPVLLREDGHTDKAVMYAKSVALDNTEQQGAVIVFVIRDSKLLENIILPNYASVAVLDKENRLVASTGFEHKPDFLLYNRFPDRTGLFYDYMGEKKVAVSYTTAASTEWKYVSMIPAELFDEKMDYMKKLIFASIGLCILVGGIVSLILIQKNYGPIRFLIRGYASKAGVPFDEGSNEYRFLQDTLNDTFAEKEKIGSRLRQHHDAIRSHFLRSLLKGRVDPNIPMHESLAAHGIQMVSTSFAVLSFHIENYGKFEDTDDVDPFKVKQLQFIIMNVAEEVAGERHQAFTVEMDDMPICIVNLRFEPDHEELLRMVRQVKSFLLEHFHVRLTAAISGVHEDLYGIQSAYQEALEAMEYRLVMGSGETILYDDIRITEAAGRPRSYYYPLHVEQQLINFVKTGNFERSNHMVEEIIDINVKDGSLSVPLAKCLMFDLISTLLKTLDEIGTIGKQDFIEHANPVDLLIHCETIKDMRIHIRDVLEQVCQSIQEERMQEHNQLSQQITAYVQENYHSDNLNITMIGAAFGLTPSYLSKQFKMQTGEALLDVINKTRLVEAKKLLVQQTLPIAEVARRVGCPDINTFNRIFKKFEGITPGKYREFL
jgi:AraC-like DNA-binding protein